MHAYMYVHLVNNGCPVCTLLHFEMKHLVLVNIFHHYTSRNNLNCMHEAAYPSFHHFSSKQ